MTLRLNLGDAYLTNYIPWNAKYRYEFPNYVGLVMDMYVYPIPYSEFERIRYGDDSLFTLMTHPEWNSDYYSYEIIKTHSNLVNQDLIIQEYRQYWYHAYHPDIDVLIIWATDDPNGDLLPEPEQCDCEECLQEREEFKNLLSEENEVEQITPNPEEFGFRLAREDEDCGVASEQGRNLIQEDEYVDEVEEDVCDCDECLQRTEV